MPTLHIGVFDLPHLDPRHSTGDIAAFLEARYGLFSGFYEMHKAEIHNMIAQSYANAVVSVLRHGAPRTLNPYGRAISQIEHLFKQDIDMRRFDGRLPGVPTQASLEGRSKRFKSGFTRGRRARPSFLDTGILRGDIAVWVD
jgi:hypothetical protein